MLTGGIDRSVCGGSVEEDYRCYTTATCLGTRVAHYMICCNLGWFCFVGGALERCIITSEICMLDGCDLYSY